MAKDTVVLSPEYVCTGKREGPADEAIQTGVFVKLSATGIALVAATEASLGMVSVENMASAQSLDYTYQTGEHMFAQVLPQGCLLQVKAVADTYTHGQALEVGADGMVAAQSAGITVAHVALRQGATISAGQSLVVQLA